MALRIMRLDASIHDRGEFCCGEPSLDKYLREQASQHQRDGIATSHVLFDDGAPSHILGYCTLAAAQLELKALQPSDRKRLPGYPVPATRIARLAVSQAEWGKGYGRLLLGHAMNCARQLRAQMGMKVVAVDALHEHAAAFYRLHGFRETTQHARTLYLPLGKAGIAGAP